MNQLLSEAKTRGIDIDPDTVNQLSGRKVRLEWYTTPEGFFYKRDGLPYVPNPKQRAFIDARARYVAFFAGRGAGKSSASAQKALRKLREGESGFVINPDFENLKISTWPEFREWCPWKNVIAKHQHRANFEWMPNGPFDIVFTNGAVATFKGVANPDSARGPNRNWLWFDEATRGTDFTGEAWKVASASIRVGKNPQCWISATPVGLDHWTYKFFILQDIPDEVKAMYDLLEQDLIQYFHTSIEDNKDNLDPGFYAGVLAQYTTEWQRQREVMGEFSNAGGVLGDRAWFDGKIIYTIPEDVRVVKRIRFWDLAASERKIAGKKQTDPDYTVGTLMAKGDDGNFYIEDQISGQWIWSNIKSIIVQTAKADGSFVRTIVEEEPGSGGKNQVAELAELVRKECPGSLDVQGWRPEGDKIIRANPWYAEARNGKIWIIKGTWNEAFLDQFSIFPVGHKDDRIDSVSGARHNIAPIRTWKSIDFLSIGIKKNEEILNL